MSLLVLTTVTTTADATDLFCGIEFAADRRSKDDDRSMLNNDDGNDNPSVS